MAEQGIYGNKVYMNKVYMGVVKRPENHIFLWLHSYIYFKFLPSKSVNLDVFLPIKEFSVARALIPRKYMVEQG